MKFKAVIFDLDGTIANTLPLCIAAFKLSIEPLLGKKISNEEITATFGPSEEGTIRKLIPEHENAGLEAYLYHYKALHTMCPQPFKGIKELLQLLVINGVQLAMVTGKGAKSTKLSLDQFELQELFNIVETGSPDGPNKINGIRSVLCQLQVPALESLYVGDAPSDIRYCKEIGIPIAAANWAPFTDAGQLEVLHPEYLFHSVEDFSAWILSHT